MQKSKAQIVFIVNPISGTRSKEGFEQLVSDTLDAAKYDWRIVKTAYAGHASVIAAQCVSEHVDICVAVGGDGTVNEVARALVMSPTALGIVPCGSGNGLARHLCLPMDMKGALEMINLGRIEQFDYGIINDQPFFCTCGVGFDAFVSLKFAEAGKRGLVTYVENVLKEGLKYKPETYVIEDETGTHHYKAFLITCANAAQYGNNAYIAPGASMQDGLMDVIVMEPFNVMEAPKLAMDLFAKTLNSNSSIKTFQARRVHIRRETPGPVHFDGDPIEMGLDINVEMRPLGLLAVVNPEAIEDKASPNKMVNALSSLVNKIIIK
ncbi:MAG: YegS/Rv2252/BmrU family lipid kinase [Prevotella sp.]|nr:YegS/Rv2252/BmrU family lipid kinase [Prevotella sp.]